MKKCVFCRPERIGFSDPCYNYILMAAVISFLYMTFAMYAQVMYEHCLIVPCLLFLGNRQAHRRDPEDVKRFLLPGAMTAWFLFLQIKRNLEGGDISNIGLFLSVYLFAFPMAALLGRENDLKGLKIFAAAYLAGAAVLCADGLLLVLDCLPDFLDGYVYWDGSRLAVIWHPNMVACYFMIGIVFCTTFLAQAKTFRTKLAFGVLLAALICALALTSCRTMIILTGGYLGSILFYMMIRRGKKWFLPGILVVAVMTVAVYKGSMFLYQANQDRLISQYTQQQSEPAVTPEPDISMAAPESPVEETGETEKPDSGNASAVTDAVDGELKTSSPQGTLIEDIGTLNSRTKIWKSAWHAIRDTPSIWYWGMHDPGWYVSYYSTFPILHLHNAWLQCFVGLGFAGLLMAMLFTMITCWNCLIILVKHHRNIWKRNVAILALCLMVACMLEPYLFYTKTSVCLINFMFFLCAGCLLYWQEEDNRNILRWILGKLHLIRK